MSYFNRYKWLFIAFILLIALNVATLAAFWLVRERHAGPPPGQQGNVVEFLSAELGFDSLQKQKLLALNKAHQEQMHGIRLGNREAKDAFFALLRQQNVPDSILEKAAGDAEKYDAKTDILTFHHFQQVRNICTEEQKKKFDNIIQQVLRMNGQPGNQPGPPPPRGREGMPEGPPPDDERREPPPPQQ